MHARAQTDELCPDPTPTNLSRDASGNLINPDGFGAVIAVSPARQIQLMARFHF